HGHETGRVVQLADGAMMEVHRPLTPYERWELVSYHDNQPLEIEPERDKNGVERPGYKKDRRKQKLSRFFYEDRVAPVTPAELAAAQHDHAHVASESIAQLNESEQAAVRRELERTTAKN
ncbi:MAG: hypothetical protein Q4Q03_07415, partial [Bowdeniella nasicola]|nr:hypothetical protein [Bowdeniella nasicola]